MKKLLTSIALIGLIKLGQSSNYYFSNQYGDDSRTASQAQNPSTPWKTISKLNSYFPNLQPGDSILFCRGESFSGSIIVQKSGISGKPIIFSSYGNGTSNKPVISGLTNLINWVNKGNGIWESDCTSGTTVNTVLINNYSYPMGRYPNSNTSNKGYLNFESHGGKTQITDNELPSFPNWTGAELVMRPRRWVIDRNKISSHSGNTITYASSSGYEPYNNFGYFIQNHINTLDQLGEWFYDAVAKKMLIYFGTQNPQLFSIQASFIDNLLKIDGQSYIVINDLNFIGSNADALKINNSKNTIITNCRIQSSGINGITASNTVGLKFESNNLLNTNNCAINFNKNCSTTSVKNNTIKNTGIYPGMGLSGNETYDGIMITGNNNTIELNTIDSIGYIGIVFIGDSTLIRNNFINHFTLSKDDGGGIYTWTGATDTKIYEERKIINNIVLNGVGAGSGTDQPDYSSSEGIYLDDNSGNVEVIGNTVANCGNNGVFLHNAHNIIVKGNNVFNNNNQLRMSHDAICPNCLIRYNTVTDNVFFSKWIDQTILNLESTDDDILSFGMFDDNYYCRPFYDSLPFNISSVNAGIKINLVQDLQMWQALFFKDFSSHKSPVGVPYYIINSTSGLSKYSNSNFSSNTNGVTSYAATGSIQVSWSDNGKLDGGSLQYSFLAAQPAISKIIIPAGVLNAGKQYLLKYSLVGAKNNRTIGTFLRQSSSPFGKLTPVSYCKISTKRSENEFLFTSNTSENADIIFEVDDKDSTLWFDNIRFEETSATLNNPDDFIRFEYNSTPLAKTITLNDVYVDANDKQYTGNLILAPFSSIILIKIKSVSTGMEKTQKSEGDNNPPEMTIYPNPAEKGSSISIKIPGFSADDLLVVVYDIFGRELYSKVTIYEEGGILFSYDNDDRLPSGVYIIVASSDDSIFKQRLIVH